MLLAKSWTKKIIFINIEKEIKMILYGKEGLS